MGGADRLILVFIGSEGVPVGLATNLSDSHVYMAFLYFDF